MENGLYISQLLPFDDMRRVCAETGAGIELIEFAVADNLDHLEQSMRKVRRELKGFDIMPELTVHGPFLDLNPASWDSYVYEGTARRFEQAYGAALALGAKKIVLHTGFYPHANFLQGWPERMASFFSGFLENRTEMQVVMENLFDPFPEPLLEVYERVNNPCFKLCLDIGHAHCYSRVPVTEWAEKLLPALGHVHIHDNGGFDPMKDHPDEHLALGRGTLPLDALFAVLRRGSGLSYVIECNTIQDVMRSYEYFQGAMK
ncbi:MAG: sugar phosphate isomerase/epimerase [Clostridia bacterium]|nr:sugar phosphate isomerase/epimerase [Clostridia bacterium]